MGRWARSASVRRFLAEHHAKAVLRTGDPETGGDIWWAAPGTGWSFGAAVDAWADQEQGLVDDALVVIPLDRRIYLAQVMRRVVEGERVLTVEKGISELQKARQSGVIVYAADLGAQRKAVREYVKLEPLSLDLWGHRFQRRSIAFLRAGLVHPAQGAALAILLGATILANHDWSQRQVAEQVERAGAGLVESGMAAFDGSAQAKVVVEALGADSLLPLYRDGLASVTYTPPTRLLTYGGASRGSYPSAAASFASCPGNEFRISEKGWTIACGVAARADMRALDGFGHGTVARRVFEAGRRAGGTVEIKGVVNESRTVVSQYEVAFAGGAHQLSVFADGIEGYPVAVRSVDCELGEWRVKGCTVKLAAEGTKGA